MLVRWAFIVGGSSRGRRPARGFAADIARHVSRDESVVWLGARYPTTHAHYDTNTNFLCRWLGQITLWPPSLVDESPCTPAATLNASVTALAVEEAPSRAMQVVLEEGDVLPSLHILRIMCVSLQMAVSVAMWTDSAECAKKDALSTLPLPWEGEWSFEAGRSPRRSSYAAFY